MKLGRIAWGGLLLIVAIAGMAWADDEPLKLTVEAKPNMVAPGQTFSFIVTVSGSGLSGGLPDPNLPRLKTFEIVGKSSSTEVSMVNFSATSTKRIVYEVLVPDGTKEGDYSIPVVTMPHEGKTYRAGPVEVRVDLNAPPRANGAQQTAPRFPGFGSLGGMGRQVEKDDLLVEMVANKTEVVPYEYLTATFAFLRGVTLWEQPGYDRPTFSGFWVEDLPFEPGKSNFTRRIGDKNYHGASLRYALTPLSTGELTIDPARITVAADPWSPRFRLATDPVTIKVVDFPDEGKPASFNGMVGSYTVTAVVEPASVPVNGGATLKLTIRGEGYLKPASPPVKPTVEKFELFDPKVDDQIDNRGGKLMSTRTVAFPLIAREGGESVVPSIELAWFDPATRQYVTHRTEPIPVTVVPRTATAQPIEGAPPPTVDGAAPLVDEGHPPYDGGLYWLALLMIVPLLAGAKVMGDKRRRLLNDIPYARKIAALATAKERLASLSNDQRGEKVDEAFRGYLADRLGAPVPALAADEISTLLEGVDDPLRAEVMELVASLLQLRFAPPGSGNDAGIAQRLLAVIEKLEGVLP